MSGSVHTEIEFVVEWTVTGDNARFRECAHAAADMVRNKEPRARRYQWYENKNGSVYMLTECYADSEAMLLHMKNIAALLPELERFGKVTRFEILGNLSAEAEAAAASIGAVRFAYVEGVNR